MKQANEEMMDGKDEFKAWSGLMRVRGKVGKVGKVHLEEHSGEQVRACDW